MVFTAEQWHEFIHWLSEHTVLPVLALMHIQSIAGNPDDIAEAMLIGCLQVTVIACVLRPLETFAPAEVWTDRRLTHVDRKYTLLNLLGLNPLFAFLVLTPFANFFGVTNVSTDTDPARGLLHWIPGIEQHPYLTFALYYIVYDLIYYWMHRAQHAVPWWWALHSMHHSQRQMSCWTDDRDCYLDGALQALVLASAGLIMGVDASQFALLGLVGELMQKLSHTNTRLGFGRFLEKIFVDPRFHRLHHMRVDPYRPNLHNSNFGLVLSIWDSMFGTALFGESLRPTGVSDPIVDADNGRELIAMQWGTLRRFWSAFRRPTGWRFGDVSFGADYTSISKKHLGFHVLTHGSDHDMPNFRA